MTSTERREARYQRRRASRMAKRRERMRRLDDFDKVFSYENLYDGYRKSRRNVTWKGSVQRYIAQAPINMWRTYDELHTGSYRPRGFTEFDICERGKTRHIRSVGISERVLQRCLCDHCLAPAMSRSFVYDNGASLTGKGYSFTLARLRRHLQEHYRRHGTDGYVLLFDFSKFFESVSHEKAKAMVASRIADERLLDVCFQLIDAYPGDSGLGLGSQISQILALAIASPLDHQVKEQLHVRCYGRYMDDGYLIHPSKNYLRQCLAAIRRTCVDLGITLNERKTQIVRLSRGFTFLKVRHWLLDTGRVLRKAGGCTFRRMRDRLRSFRRMVDAGRMAVDDVWQSLQSWRSYVSRFDSRKAIAGVERLYARLFGPARNMQVNGLINTNMQTSVMQAG